MANFREAFTLGLDAYDNAERAREEISEVFDELAKQVHEGSHGAIRIEWNKSMPLATIQTLYAYNARGDVHNQLCRYELADRGYPVNLLYSRERVRCHGRESLELGLQDMLKHPTTGGILHQLMHPAS